MAHVLVTGATGYLGGRLTPRLIEAGHTVRCLTRSPQRLTGVPWHPEVEVAPGDVQRPESLTAALRGVDVAYYLVHSIGAGDFEAADRRGAENFAAAARQAGVRRIVYLGGPASTPRHRSAHLRSREEVARILLGSGVPTVVLRAAVILGSGSTSFEMLRYLTEHLPMMVAPRWVHNRVQPIAVHDVLHYLLAAAELPPTVHQDFDICGPDVLTFADMMRRYARIDGLPPRVIVPVRPLTPRLSSYWVGLVTPVPGRLARPLVESLVHEAVCRDHHAIADHVPDPPGGLTSFDTAVRLALAHPPTERPESRWSTATAPADPLPTDPEWAGGTVYTDTRAADVAAPPARLQRAVESFVGETGWHRPPLAGSARGGGDGGRGEPGGTAGQADVRLRADSRLPGRAWLEVRVVERGSDASRYEQRLVFLPRGALGHLFWLGATPARRVVFHSLLRKVTHAAETHRHQ